MSPRTDALNSALERFSAYAYLDGPGLAFHGPMGAEALSSLGHDGEVVVWADAYAATHPAVAPPPAGDPIDPTDDRSWRSALGDVARVTDWDLMFTRELAESPIDDVLGLWIPRLASGHAGGLTHGLLRTAHAVRALPDDAAPSSLMVAELAKGLASWAAWYRALPGHPRWRGRLSFREALGHIPRPTREWTPMEAATFARFEELTGFGEAVEAVGPIPDAERSLSDLSAVLCRVLSTMEPVPIALVHMVTPIAATRTLMARVPALDPNTVLIHMWKVAAGLIASSTRHLVPDERDPGREEPTTEALVALAVAHGDPHVIKFTEACRREHRIAPDPAYLRAAAGLIAGTPRP